MSKQPKIKTHETDCFSILDDKSTYCSSDKRTITNKKYGTHTSYGSVTINSNEQKICIWEIQINTTDSVHPVSIGIGDIVAYDSNGQINDFNSGYIYKSGDIITMELNTITGHIVFYKTFLSRKHYVHRIDIDNNALPRIYQLCVSLTGTSNSSSVTINDFNTITVQDYALKKQTEKKSKHPMEYFEYSGDYIKTQNNQTTITNKQTLDGTSYGHYVINTVSSNNTYRWIIRTINIKASSKQCELGVGIAGADALSNLNSNICTNTSIIRYVYTNNSILYAMKNKLSSWLDIGSLGGGDDVIILELNAKMNSLICYNPKKSQCSRECKDIEPGQYRLAVYLKASKHKPSVTINEFKIIGDDTDQCVEYKNEDPITTANKAIVNQEQITEGAYARVKGLLKVPSFNGKIVKIVAYVEKVERWKVKILDTTKQKEGYLSGYLGVREANMVPIIWNTDITELKQCNIDNVIFILYEYIFLQLPEDEYLKLENKIGFFISYFESKQINGEYLCTVDGEVFSEDIVSFANDETLKDFALMLLQMLKGFDFAQIIQGNEYEYDEEEEVKEEIQDINVPKDDQSAEDNVVVVEEEQKQIENDDVVSPLLDRIDNQNKEIAHLKQEVIHVKEKAMSGAVMKEENNKLKVEYERCNKAQQQVLSETREKHEALKANYNNALEEQQHLQAENQLQNNQLEQLKLEMNALKQENSQLKDEEKEYVMTINDLKNEIKTLKVKAIDINAFMEWDSEDVLNWLFLIENGLFTKYEKKLKKQIVDNEICGKDLITINIEDITYLGVTKFSDKKLLMNHIQTLIQINEKKQNASNEQMGYNENEGIAAETPYI